MSAVAGHGLLRLPVLPGDNGADPGRSLEQLCRFVMYDLQVTLFRCFRIMPVYELLYLSFSNSIGGVGHDFHDMYGARFHHHLEGAGIKKITDQDACLITPALVGSGLAPAQHGSIDHVVMQQGGGMDKLDDGGKFNVQARVICKAVGAEQHQCRPQSFPATVDDVMGLID